jgi:Flp pilus assembly protein TadG
MIRRLFHRAAADQEGAAAVEFALIFPVLFVLHVAAAEALEVYIAQRNVAHIAAAMADIMAQSRVVTQADVDDVLLASTAMMHPFPEASLQQRVSSLTANAAGTVATDWSVRRSYDGAANPSVPAGYLLANESAIVTDVIYDYKPTFGLFLPKTIRFTRHAYVRPRLSTKVEKVG